MSKKLKAYYDYLLLVLLLLAMIAGLLFQGSVDLLLLAVSILGILPILLSTIKALRKREITVDLLAVIALVLSIIGGELLSAVFINLMVSSARILDGYTESRTRSALQKLNKLRPTEARVKRGDDYKIVPLAEVHKGDQLLVQLGERIPADGVVIKGTATVDQSSFTGESLPVEKGLGDNVFSSTIVMSGNIEVTAQKVGSETSFEKIVKLVGESEKNKAKLTTTGERFAKWYILIVFGGAIVIFVLTQNLYLVLSILLVVCADDIAIAVPLAFLAGIGQAARRGIIVKGGSFLEAMASVKNIIVDKTGTITSGKFTVTNVFYAPDGDKEKILEFTATACQLSRHPVSRAIEEHLGLKENKAEQDLKFKEYSGMGVVIDYKGEHIVFGRPALLARENVELEAELKQKISEHSQQGQSVTALAYGGKIKVLFVLSDTVKANVAENVAELEGLGVKKIVMLTGDNEVVAAMISKEAGIKEFRANMLPEDKLDFVKDVLKREPNVVMVGDGVNDAPALTMANVGIAMGAIGSDVSVDTADVVLMDDNFAKVPEIIKISRLIVGIGRQNFAIWAVVNVIGLILVFGGVINPAGAAAFNFLTDFIPIGNSLRVFGYRPGNVK